MFPVSFFAKEFFSGSFFPPVIEAVVEVPQIVLTPNGIPYERKRRKRKASRLREELEKALRAQLGELAEEAPKEVKEAAAAVRKPYQADIEQQITLLRYLQERVELNIANQLELLLRAWAEEVAKIRELEIAGKVETQARQSAQEEQIALELKAMWLERQKRLKQQSEEDELIMLLVLLSEE